MPLPVFIPNREFLKSGAARAACQAKAEPLITAAEAGAPHLTGHLAGSLAGEWIQREDGTWVYRVIAQDFKARWLEFGTENMEGQHFLAEAAVATVGNLH